MKHIKNLYSPPLKSLSIFRFKWLRNLVTLDDVKKKTAKHARNA